MAKKKSKAGGGRLEAGGKAAIAKSEPPPVDVLELDETFERTIDGYLGYNSPFAKQKALIANLEEQLFDERAKLERMAAPLRDAMAALRSEQIQAAVAAQPYDDALAKLVAPVQLAYKSRNYGNGTTKSKGTGAKPWKELREAGATNEQILKNVKSLVAGSYSTSKEAAGYRLRCEATDGEHYLERISAGSFGGGRTVLNKTAEVVGAIRRVMGIPQPIAGATPAKKPVAGGKSKKTSTARSKKPAAKKKPSAKAATPPKTSSAKAGPKSAAKKKSSKPASTNGGLHSPRSPKTAKAISPKHPRLTSRNLLLWSADGYRVDATELVAAMTPEEKKLWGKRFVPDYPCDNEDPRLLIADHVEIFLENRHAEAEAKQNGQAATNGKHAPTNRIAGFDQAFVDKSKPALTSTPLELNFRAPVEGKTRTAEADARPEPAAVTGDPAVDRADAIASCKPMEAALLEEIFAAYPATKTKAQITTAAGYQPGGKVSAAFKSLWRAGYIDEIGRSTVKASAAYFDAAAAVVEC